MEDQWLTVSGVEQKWLGVLNHLDKGAVTEGKAARYLGISERQMKRVRAR